MLKSHRNIIIVLLSRDMDGCNLFGYKDVFLLTIWIVKKIPSSFDEWLFIMIQ